MNPLVIETAIREAFLASAFSGETIYLGSDYQDKTPESLNIVISCGELDHVVSGLYKATVTVKLTSPAMIGESSLAIQNTAIASTLAALDAGYLAANWPAGSPYFAGIFIQHTRSSQEKHEWDTEIQSTIGVSE